MLVDREITAMNKINKLDGLLHKSGQYAFQQNLVFLVQQGSN